MKQFCIFLLTFSLNAAVWAFDIGLPSQAADADEPYALSLVVEQFKREIHQDIRALDGSFFGDQEEDRLFARFACQMSPPWSFQFDAGISDSEGSEDPALLLGSAVRWSHPFGSGAEAHIFLGGVYVDGIEYKQAGAVIAGLETAAESRKEDHIEGTLGFLVSKSFVLKDTWSLTPYLGMQLSLFRGEGKESFFFESDPNLPSGSKSGIDFEEDGQMGSTLGLRLDGPAAWYLRLEGRIIDQASLSAGFGRSF